jgi:serine/threonine protein kinase
VFLEVRVLLHLNSLQHPSVVELLGYGWDLGPLPYLVLELADLGSLNNFLQENPLSWSQKELTMVQLASGLEMLHSCEIIHGDIKLENILVFSAPPNGFIAKLADFGFCLSDTLGAEVYHGTRVLNAPEMRYHNTKDIFKSKPEVADVYSYGLAAWEIANDGRRYYSADPIGIDSQDVDKALCFLSDMDMANQEILTYAIEFVISLSLPETLANQFTAVLRMALQRDPQSRSGIREIRQHMDPEDR